MPKYSQLVFFLFITLSVWSKPLPKETGYSVIIDTDCAIDDMRAISLLLARPEVVIKGILISDGSLPPDAGYDKIRALLHVFNRDSIPVGYGTALSGLNPEWREFNRQIDWGVQPADQSRKTDAKTLFTGISGHTTGKLILVCLGPLTNLAGIVQSDTSALRKIARVIWYHDPANPSQGFNYNCDKKSADVVLNSGLQVTMIANLRKPDAVFDTALYRMCRESGTSLASLFARIHSQPAVIKRLNQGHFKLGDELVAVYLLNPELFDVTVLHNNIRRRFDRDYDEEAVREAIGDMIRGSYARGGNVVFNRFPDDRELFAYDVRRIMDSAIMRYGYDEWKANVMTDEFHGHLGVFSIVGAKMGIKAREFFGVGPDELEVVTYAGTKPPYSCLNDGIQASTGATLGMGTIHLAPDSITEPAAIFRSKGRAVRMNLRPEYLDQVNQDIREGIIRFGLLDDGYWKLIRRNALRYWLEWDRNEIFTIKEL